MRPYLSLSLLAYNEKATLAAAAHRCSEALQKGGYSYELVLVDDGSTDGSDEIIRHLVEELPHSRAIFHERNLGIGAGIRTCYFSTIGEWATWFPADLQADPGELPSLLSHLPSCDVLVTYRDASQRQERLLRKLLSCTDRTVVRLFFGVALKDLHWIRFFHRALLDRMIVTSRSPFIDTEMIVCANRLGARIRQLPLPDRPREHGQAKGGSLANILTAVRDLLSLRIRSIKFAPEGQVGTQPEEEEVEFLGYRSPPRPSLRISSTHSGASDPYYDE